MLEPFFGAFCVYIIYIVYMLLELLIFSIIRSFSVCSQKSILNFHSDLFVWWLAIILWFHIIRYAADYRKEENGRH